MRLLVVCFPPSEDEAHAQPAAGGNAIQVLVRSEAPAARDDDNAWVLEIDRPGLLTPPLKGWSMAFKGDLPTQLQISSGEYVEKEEQEARGTVVEEPIVVAFGEIDAVVRIAPDETRAATLAWLGESGFRPVDMAGFYAILRPDEEELRDSGLHDGS
jgi:hypothetical protein